MSDLVNEETSSAVCHQQKLLVRVVEISNVFNLALSFPVKRYPSSEFFVVVREDQEVAASFVNLKHDVEVRVQESELNSVLGLDCLMSSPVAPRWDDFVELTLRDHIVWAGYFLFFEDHKKCLFPTMDQHLLTSVPDWV